MEDNNKKVEKENNEPEQTKIIHTPDNVNKRR